jgi:2-keto-4-pentenoate hydratase/2-oxohepta-3-ene-1,7-dioic acid hydratase in catechol pathway
MKYCRFLFEDKARYGKVEDRGGEPWIVDLIAAPDFFSGFGAAPGESKVFEPILLRDAELLPPVTPSKIICVGRNYREHVRELGNEVPAEPLLFFKPPSSLLAPGGVVRLPSFAERVDFEGELVLVVGKRARKLPPDADWRKTIRGCTLANDVSARDLQKKDGQWARAKGCDTFCPIGPIVSDELDLDAGVTLETRVNGELRQQGSTADFIFSIPALLSAITAAFTLEPGDIILTGTPSGVGPIKPGDRVEISVPGLDILTHSVAADTD